MIRSENAQHAAWIFVDVAGRDLGSYVRDARAAVAQQLKLPPGYQLVFSGQFEYWEKTLPRLYAASVITLITIVLLLYVGTQSWFRVAVVMLAVLRGIRNSCPVRSCRNRRATSLLVLRHWSAPRLSDSH